MTIFEMLESMRHRCSADLKNQLVVELNKVRELQLPSTSGLLFLKDLENLSDALEGNKTVTHLGIEGQNFGMSGAQIGITAAEILAKMVKHSALTHLYIERNGITDEGAQILLKEIRLNPRLLCLDFSHASDLCVLSEENAYDDYVFLLKNIKKTSPSNCWDRGNYVSENTRTALNEALYKKRLAYLQKKCAEAKAEHDLALKRTTEKNIAVIKNDAFWGGVAGGVVAGVAALAGFVSLPVVLPAAVTGIAIGSTNAYMNKVNFNYPNKTELKPETPESLVEQVAPSQTAEVWTPVLSNTPSSANAGIEGSVLESPNSKKQGLK